MTNPTATVLIGLPASGKSTYTKSLSYDFFKYSTDDQIEELASHYGLTYSEAFADSYDEALSLVNSFLDIAKSQRKNIVFDQTNLAIKKRKATLENLPGGYRKIGVCFLPPSCREDLEILKYRLGNRQGKEIGWGIVKGMMKTFDMPTITEGFDEIHYFDPFPRGGMMRLSHVDSIFWHFTYSRSAIADINNLEM